MLPIDQLEQLFKILSSFLTTQQRNTLTPHLTPAELEWTSEANPGSLKIGRAHV